MHHQIVDIAIISILSFYFLLTIAYHFDTTHWVVRNFDFFGLIPKWNFFAPTPGVHNLYLLYRLKYEDENLSHWKALFDLDKFRNLWTCLWNPSRRLKKALFDLIATLVLEDASTEENRARIKLSIPYLLILHHLSSYEEEGATGVQFLVMENYDRDPASAIFTSEMHAL